MEGVRFESEVRRIETDPRKSGWAAHTRVEREILCWTRLAEEINVYTLTVDDLTNDLSRDCLAEVLSCASDDLRDVTQTRVASADHLFHGSTIEDDEGRLRRYLRIKPEDGWWWHRQPSMGP